VTLPHIKLTRHPDTCSQWVKTHICTIVFLQETHIDENIEKVIRNNSKFEIVSGHGTSASRGVSILLNKS
jgi:exonuclease III